MKSLLLTVLILAGCGAGEVPEAQIAPVEPVKVVEPEPAAPSVKEPEWVEYCPQSSGCAPSPEPYKPRNRQ